jgi:hypothetical protein
MANTRSPIRQNTGWTITNQLWRSTFKEEAWPLFAEKIQILQINQKPTGRSMNANTLKTDGTQLVGPSHSSTAKPNKQT